MSTIGSRAIRQDFRRAMRNLCAAAARIRQADATPQKET